MWERLTPADIDRAKEQLIEERTAMLARHAAELEALTAAERQIDDFARLAGAFVEKYVAADARSTRSTPSHEEAPTLPATVEESEPPGGLVRQETPVQIEVHQQVSPNSGGPFRRFVRR